MRCWLAGACVIVAVQGIGLRDSGSGSALAQTSASSPCPAAPDVAEAERRRRPGVAQPDSQTVACHPERMAAPANKLLPPSVAIPDRWRLVEKLGRKVNLLDPYAPSNPLKGDRPLFGDSVFTNLSATSVSLLEPRRIPTSDALTIGVPAGATRTLTRDQLFFSETMTFDALVYKGDTVFRPPDWQWRFAPAVNYSGTRVGSEESSGGLFAIQGLSFEKHLRDVSTRYDFDSLRVGIQPITSDFRGFLLADQPLALRLFGTRADNVYQYNLALITRLPKDRVRLNDVGQRIPDNQILLSNLYWQDLFMQGLNSEFIFAYNRNRTKGPQLLLAPDVPAGLSAEAARDYDVAYVGYAVDGHIGRLNTTAVVYGLAGREQRGTFVDQSTEVRALFAADELSMDFDWRRVRFSMLHASGDGNPYDRRAQGFDTLTSGAIFAGSDSSFFFHQRLALAGGAFDLKSRDGLLPSLRAAGNSGTANFSNPGLNLAGVGLDLNLTPQLTLSVDANQLWFDKTAVLEALLNQPNIPTRLGAELVVNANWRPFASQNLILRLSGSQLAGGPGYRAVYGGANPFSVFASLTLTY